MKVLCLIVLLFIVGCEQPLSWYLPPEPDNWQPLPHPDLKPVDPNKAHLLNPSYVYRRATMPDPLDSPRIRTYETAPLDLSGHPGYSLPRY